MQGLSKLKNDECFRRFTLCYAHLPQWWQTLNVSFNAFQPIGDDFWGIKTLLQQVGTCARTHD